MALLSELDVLAERLERRGMTEPAALLDRARARLAAAAPAEDVLPPPDEAEAGAVEADHLNPGTILRWKDGTTAFVVEFDGAAYHLSNGSEISDQQIDEQVMSDQLEILSPHALDVAEELAEVAEDLDSMGQPVLSGLLDDAIEAWALEAPGKYAVQLAADFEGFEDERAESGRGQELIRQAPETYADGLPAEFKGFIESAAPGKVYQAYPSGEGGWCVRLHRFTPKEVLCVIQHAMNAGRDCSTGNENRFPWREVYFGDYEDAEEQLEDHAEARETTETAVRTQKEGAAAPQRGEIWQEIGGSTKAKIVSVSGDQVTLQNKLGQIAMPVWALQQHWKRVG